MDLRQADLQLCGTSGADQGLQVDLRRGSPTTACRASSRGGSKMGTGDRELGAEGTGGLISSPTMQSTRSIWGLEDETGDLVVQLWYAVSGKLEDENWRLCSTTAEVPGKLEDENW